MLVPSNLTPLMGRESALESLHDVYTLPRRPVVYVWGAPGTGKTFLVQHFSDDLQADTYPVLWSSARSVGQSEPEWEWHLSQFLQYDSTLPRDTITQAMIARCQTEPFCWIVDDFDYLGTIRSWMVQLAFDLGRKGGCVILIGRTSPFQLWPGQSYIRSHMKLIELTNWEPEVAERDLIARGITDKGIVDEAIQLAHGRPQLLAAIADGLSLLKATAIPTESRPFILHSLDLTAYLIEQICHPGSRRLMWRAGQSSESLDTLIAAASVLPVFNREWMIRTVGRTLVSQRWDEFITLPFLDSYRGGYFGLFPHLRRQISSTVQKIRPWMWEQWTRKSAQYYCARMKSGATPPHHAWSVLSRFIRPRLGIPLFDTKEPGLHAQWEYHTTSPDVPALLHLVNAQGQVVASSRFLVENPQILHITESTWDVACSETVIQLVSAIASTFYRYPRIVWSIAETPPDLETLLEALQFARDTEGKWILDLTQRGFDEWLELLVKPPTGHIPANAVTVVQSTLQALHDGTENYGAEVDQFWEQFSAYGSFRTWFLDALHSSVHSDGIDGKTILVLYYLDRRGTHEELAELLHVSRATYFRNHRNALEKLATAVFH